MLRVAENKRLSAAAALATILLLLVGFGLGRLTGAAPAPAAPSQAGRVAALRAQLTRLQSEQRSTQAQLAALQVIRSQDARLQASDRRLTAQLGAARACTPSPHPRLCLRHALP